MARAAADQASCPPEADPLAPATAAMPASAPSRYLETEFEEARVRSDYKRQRQIAVAAAREAGRTECEQCLNDFCCCCDDAAAFCCCCCRRGSKAAASLLLYTAFPALAVADFVLGLVAKNQGWYPKCLGELVCAWSATACAVWIALAMSAIFVFSFAVVAKLAAVLKSQCCGGKDKARTKERERGRKRCRTFRSEEEGGGGSAVVAGRQPTDVIV